MIDDVICLVIQNDKIFSLKIANNVFRQKSARRAVSRALYPIFFFLRYATPRTTQTPNGKWQLHVHKKARKGTEQRAGKKGKKPTKDNPLKLSHVES
jgi:hypothetical protein